MEGASCADTCIHMGRLSASASWLPLWGLNECGGGGYFFMALSSLGSFVTLTWIENQGVLLFGHVEGYVWYGGGEATDVAM